MKTRVVSITVFLALAFLILASTFTSLNEVRYAFAQSATPMPILGQKVDVDYALPFAGKIEPDHPIWPVKALRDRTGLLLRTKLVKKIDVLITLADKRIQYADHLMSKDKSELSVSTLTKAEKYLEEASLMEKKARDKNIDTKEAAKKLALSSLKHRQILEELLAKAPEDAKPVIVKTIDLNKRVYNEARSALNQQGVAAPENPFKD